MTSLKPATLLLLLLACVAVVPRAAAAQDQDKVYLRASAGYDRSSDVVLLDRSCDPTPLLAYFGCGEGEDGQRLGAYGDAGSGPTVEVAVGARVLRPLRVELALAHRPGFAFDANANFRAAGGNQPVAADVTESAVIVLTVVDVAPLLGLDLGRFEPFASAGLGFSRNRIGSVAYDFPELTAKPATTTTGGGVHWDPAWDLGLGAALRLGSKSRLEIAYRYSDFGRLETADGPIEVVRNLTHLHIDNVAGTRAPLRSRGLYLGLRQSF